TLHQSTRSWYGIGGSTVIEALARWKERYRETDSVHHTEELCYQHACEQGFYTLTAEIRASKRREVYRASLSFQLRGIPLDSEPIRHLCKTLDVASEPYFRPRTDKSIASTRFGRRETLNVEPVALIVEENQIDTDGSEWVG